MLSGSSAYMERKMESHSSKYLRIMHALTRTMMTFIPFSHKLQAFLKESKKIQSEDFSA